MNKRTTHSFPFAAVVGLNDVKAALIANAIDPLIGGVLVRGNKGTGKSTVIRSFHAILPDLTIRKGCPYHCDPYAASPMALCDECRNRSNQDNPETGSIPMPFVELPLNASEDRVAGTVHLEKTLASGKRTFEPGLLAAANRGILYVDEVNLLEDHLVDLLLDAAASGVNTVEREGMSVTHPARFMLIGTMNPEEGELRPQFLDRFGLCVSVPGSRSVELRRLIMQRRLAFEQDPEQFINDWQQADIALREQILVARNRLPETKITANALDRAIETAVQAGSKGHRAELAIIKAARALAAFSESPTVENEHVAQGARLALLHRVQADITETLEECVKKVNRIAAETIDPESRSEKQTDTTRALLEADDDYLDEMMQVPGNFAASGIVDSFLKKKLGFSSPPIKPA